MKVVVGVGCLLGATLVVACGTRTVVPDLPGINTIALRVGFHEEGTPVSQNLSPRSCSRARPRSACPTRWSDVQRCWWCAVFLLSERAKEEAAVGMWESRVLCEISKVRWESVWDFHGTAISTADDGGPRAATGGHRVASFLSEGLRRGRYDSPSMTRS